MATRKHRRGRITVTPLEEFLRSKPAGFTVTCLESGYRVQGDREESLVLIDDLDSPVGRVTFPGSLGRTVATHNQWKYSDIRRSLLSRTIYLLASAHDPPVTGKTGHYIVAVNGADPFIRWQMERGLDWAISSVAGESYSVDIGFSEALMSLAARHTHNSAEPPTAVSEWKNASFTLKYSAGALFDLPYWFGFSKRSFKVLFSPSDL